MAKITLLQLDNDKRLQVLEKLGYSIDNDGFVVSKKTKKEVVCKYTNEKIHINTAAILPGSHMIVNATPMSMAQYFVEQSDNE